MFPWISSLISAGSSLIGGIMNQNAKEKELEANQRQLDIQNAARLRDEAFRQEQFDYQKAQNTHSEEVQREFAQSGIQWRVQDAIKAGLHPLAALGGGGASFSSPTASVGSIGGAPSRTPSSGSAPIGSSISAMGQDISRAMQASASQDTRLAAMNESAQMLQLEGLKLRNDLTKAQLASVITRQMSGQVGPSMPTPTVPAEGPFPVPENPKPEQRPGLMFGGRRWATNPDTSPMKAWEDQYGDEGPVASTLPIFILYNDFLANYGQPATWPRQIMNDMWQRTKNEFDFGSNPRQSKPLGRR